jgi:hypothetical protein
MPLVGLVVARAAASVFLAPAVRDLPCAIPSVVVADLAWLVCVIAVVAATIVAVLVLCGLIISHAKIRHHNCKTFQS